MHQNKGKTIARCLKDRTDYAKNGEKTDHRKETKWRPLYQEFLLPATFYFIIVQNYRYD